MTDDPLLTRLRRLSTEQLADLLRRRPDVVGAHEAGTHQAGTHQAGAQEEPADLAELAERLVDPASLSWALQHQPRPAWQLVEAALALGGQPTTADLAAALTARKNHHHDVQHLVNTLEDLAVLTRDGDTLYLPHTLYRLFPAPLGLGPPMAVLLAQTTVDTMRALARNLGLPRPRSRWEAEQALVDLFADPANVERLLATAPPAVRTVLQTGPDADPHAQDAEHPHAYRVRLDALHHAAALGLVVELGYGYDWHVPAEVTLALRGPDYRAPFDVQPPPVPAHPADPTHDGAAAASDALATTLALLDHLTRRPAPMLKSGGLGTRELTKLAKTVGTDEPTLRLALELADALGLLHHADQLRTSDHARTWRDRPPSEQFAAVLTAWWTLGHVPTVALDESGKAQRAIVQRNQNHGNREARHALLDVLAALPAGTGAEFHDVVARARWSRPAAQLGTGKATGMATGEEAAHHWREAELLGVLAGGALTPLGRALVQQDDLTAVAERLLPAAAEHATFGSDLTVFVAGTPAARVTAVLDAAADREGRGGAITWRFTPGSVRRAFDDGATADGLLAELAAVAQAELPQPLRYLIADVARRHGHLRLSAATSVVRSDDAALLALVAADRSLAKHGVRLLAPTVLAADVPVATLLAALRSAGYFPVAEGGVDGADESSSSAHRTVRTIAEHQTGGHQPEPDWLAVAARIAAGRRAPTIASATERRLARLNHELSRAEVRQLARAVDGRGRVGIEYLAASGNRTRRVIDVPELIGASLAAWCELRQAEREFVVSRIESVRPV